MHHLNRLLLSRWGGSRRSALGNRSSTFSSRLCSLGCLGLLLGGSSSALDRRGSLGGYTLARPPEEISVLDVLIAVEGHALQFSGNPAGRSGRRVRQAWSTIAAELEAKTRAQTFDQIASREPDSMYYI